MSLFAALIVAAVAVAAPPREISQDRELKEIDLSGWDCLNRMEGTAKTDDGRERNRLKNRSMPASIPGGGREFDLPAFVKYVAQFDSETKGKRRKDLGASEKKQLDELEGQIVSLTGYLVIAYSGPPESTNCGSVDFHDWHLELFEKPADHAPRIGDPTPIVCEPTPRTQTALYRDGVRLQSLAGFIRAPDMTIEPTGHKALKIRVTGYLMWDDDHNGRADIGPTIRRVEANGYHQPWRATAWEIHPVLKIEPLEKPIPPSQSAPLPATTPAASSPISPAVSPASTSPPVTEESTPASPAPPFDPTASGGTSISLPRATLPPISTTPLPVSTTTPLPQEFVTVTQAVKIKIPYGETILPAGLKLPVVSRDAQTVTVQYMGAKHAIPVGSTDSP